MEILYTVMVKNKNHTTVKSGLSLTQLIFAVTDCNLTPDKEAFIRIGNYGGSWYTVHHDISALVIQDRDYKPGIRSVEPQLT